MHRHRGDQGPVERLRLARLGLNLVLDLLPEPPGLLLALLRPAPTEEVLPRLDDPLAHLPRLKLGDIFLHLPVNPPQVQPALLVPEFVRLDRHLRELGQQLARQLAPLTVHQVGLVVLDLPEEGLALRAALLDSAHDEALDGADLAGGGVLDPACGLDGGAVSLDGEEGGEDGERGGDHAPRGGEGGDLGRRERDQDGLVLVEAVKVEAGELGRVREDVLLEVIVAQLNHNQQSQHTEPSCSTRVFAHLRYGRQVLGPQLVGEVSLCLADLCEVALEPVFAPLRVRHVGLEFGVGPDRVLGRDEDVARRE